MRKVLIPVILALFAVPAAVGQPKTAEEVLRAHVEAAGGEDAFRAITSQYSVGEISLDTPGGPIILKMERQIAFPGYALIRQTVVTAPPEIPADMLKQTVFLAPDSGWLESAQIGGRKNIQDLAGPQAAALEQQRGELDLASAELAILGNDSLEIALGEPETLNGIDVYVVDVMGENQSRRYYSTETGLLFAIETTTPMGSSVRYLSDYRSVSGVRVPFGVQIEQSGQAINVSFTEIAFDREITGESIVTEAESI